LFERGKKLVVDKGEQIIAGDAFVVGGPSAPAQI
jgi:hypothetical protein